MNNPLLSAEAYFVDYTCNIAVTQEKKAKVEYCLKTETVVFTVVTKALFTYFLFVWLCTSLI